VTGERGDHDETRIIALDLATKVNQSAERLAVDDLLAHGGELSFDRDRVEFEAG